jgi:hypothetical protein
MRDFIDGYYEESAEPIWQYNEMLRQAWETNRGDFKQKAGIRYDANIAFLTKDFVTRAALLFDQAEALAQSDRTRHRVEVARLPIIYVKLMRGPGWLDDDYLALVDRFEKIARRHGVRHLMEGPPDLDRNLKRWRTVAATPPGEFPGSIVAEESVTDCNPNCGHTLVADEDASAGYANRISNNYANTDFAANWTLPQELHNDGVTYMLRVRVRLDKTGDRGLGFRAGVWDMTRPRKTIELGGHTLRNELALVLHKVWDAKDVSGDTYKWYEVGTCTITQPEGADPGRVRVFIGGVSNPTGDVKGVYFDRAELIPIDAYKPK